MSKITITNPPAGCSLFFLVLWGYGLVSWIINLVQLLYCDFQEPWKDEIVHIVGLFPPCSMVTCWF
jgi:hypothetical protein